MIDINRCRTAGTAVLTLLSTVLFSSASLAGEKLAYPVTIDLTSRTAYGDLSTARSGSTFDSKSRIGCTVNSENSVTCTAINSGGTTVTCSKYQAAQSMVNAIMNLESDGYVSFQWDAAGTCTYVLTETSSRWAPKR